MHIKTGLLLIVLLIWTVDLTAKRAPLK